jgi:hypothetical protein
LDALFRISIKSGHWINFIAIISIAWKFHWNFMEIILPANCRADPHAETKERHTERQMGIGTTTEKKVRLRGISGVPLVPGMD